MMNLPVRKKCRVLLCVGGGGGGDESNCRD
jgi:hypothetical protein